MGKMGPGAGLGQPHDVLQLQVVIQFDALFRGKARRLLLLDSDMRRAF